LKYSTSKALHDLGLRKQKSKSPLSERERENQQSKKIPTNGDYWNEKQNQTIIGADFTERIGKDGRSETMSKEKVLNNPRRNETLSSSGGRSESVDAVKIFPAGKSRFMLIRVSISS